MVLLHYRLLSKRLIYRFALAVCSERQTVSEVVRVGRTKTTKHTNDTKKNHPQNSIFLLVVSRPVGAYRARNGKPVFFSFIQVFPQPASGFVLIFVFFVCFVVHQRTMF